jgi:murein DD-endopeptidase MepM/ murein hydrolase activator NlpD
MHVYPRVVFGKGAKVTGGYRSGHKAKDYVPKTDDPRTVFAVERGTVTSLLSGQAPGAEIANFVAVRAADGTVTSYAHVSPSVVVGKAVRVGDKIGKCDQSGTSSGYHVHLVRIPSSSGSEDDVLDGDVQETAVNFKCRGEV